MEGSRKMKLRKLLVLVVLLSLWGGTMMFADAATQKVRVAVNGSELGDSGMLIDGTTYLPLRQIAGTLQSLITWDESSKKVTIDKPNVHMFTFKDKSPFGKVTKGSKFSFWVWAQVDSLNTDISAVKIVLASPGGKEQLIQSLKVTSRKADFQVLTEEIKHEFDAAGSYAVRMYMMPSGSEDWTLVSEKLIVTE